MYAWDSITVHGPTASAERPNRKKTLQQLTNEHNYWKMRWTKWEAQSKPKQVSNIFCGVEVWFTGYTDKVSYYHLRQMVLENGGKVRYMFSPVTTTHVVCTNLAAAKERFMRRHQNVRVVHPDWILHSVKQKIRLPERNYRVLKNTQEKTLDDIVPVTKRNTRRKIDSGAHVIPPDATSRPNKLDELTTTRILFLRNTKEVAMKSKDCPADKQPTPIQKQKTSRQLRLAAQQRRKVLRTKFNVYPKAIFDAVPKAHTHNNQLKNTMNYFASVTN